MMDANSFRPEERRRSVRVDDQDARADQSDGSDSRQSDFVRDCGAVLKCKLDPARRTLYVQTTSHGMTLEFSGDHDFDELPEHGDLVRLHWGDQVEIISAFSSSWFEIRRSAPLAGDSGKDRLRTAITVGISAGLSLFTGIAVVRVGYLGYQFVYHDRAWNWLAPDIAVLFIASILLVGWRALIELRTKTPALGLQPLRAKHIASAALHAKG